MNARKGEYPDNADFKNHLLCMSKKLKLQSDTGEIDKENLLAKLKLILGSDEAVSELVGKCIAVVKGDPAQKAFAALKCFHDNTPEHINII